jgi:oligopeptide transport system substrate-binding protein
MATVLVGCSLQGCDRPRGSSEAAAELRQPVLRRALGGEPATLDPALAADNAALFLLLDLFEGLTAEAPDGRIVPGAAAHWTVSADQLRWTFHLRPGLRWSDGKPLTAAHFVAGLEAVRAASTQAPYAELLAPVVATSAPDPMTVVVELAGPVPYLPSLLAMPFASPRRDDTAAAIPVGNGPYLVVSRRPGELVELRRNPHYHDAASVAIAGVVYLTLDDLNTELNLYRSGELDVTSEVPNAQLARLRQERPGELHVAPYLSTYAYAINTRRIADRELRVALAQAVERAQITELVTGAGETPAYEWVPPGIPGYLPARFDWAGLAPPERRRQARSAWDDARERGVAPATLRLCTDASANHHRTAVALIDQWRSVLGVEVELVELEWKAYLALRERPVDCDLLRFGWSADFIDASAFLALFTSGHAQNVPGYSNPRFDALVEAAGREADDARRAALLREAEGLLLHDAVLVPVFHRVAKRLVRPTLRGEFANPLGHLATRHLELGVAEKK